MKKLILGAVATFLAVSLMGCGGGGGDEKSSSVSSVTTPSIGETDAAKALLLVDADKTVFKPAIVREYLVHASNGVAEVFVEKGRVNKIYWNDRAVGFHRDDCTKGIALQFDPSTLAVEIAGQPIGASGGNFSYVLDDGTELAQITDPNWLVIKAGAGMVAERKADGLLYAAVQPVGTAPIIIDPAAPVVIVKTRVSINTLTRQIDITPAIATGKLLNLVSGILGETVLDAQGNVIAGYRIAWNDNGSWYPAAGVVTALVLPTTVLANATQASGAGMPYLVRPDGTFVSFNTDPTVCEFFVNGVQQNVSVDGLIRY